MLKFLTLFILILFSISVRASYRIETITINDNLISNRINTLKIDSLNTLWIGSNLGLNSYNNGNVVTHDFFMGMNVESIIQLRKGEIAILSNSELYIYSYKDNKIKRVGNKDTKFTSIDLHNNKIYLTSDDNKIYCYGDSLTELSDINKLLPEMPGNAMLSGLFSTTDGRMIVTINNYGVLTLNTDNFKIENLYKTYVWRYNKIIGFENYIYIATYSGVLIFKKNGQFVREINKENSDLPGDFSMDIGVNYTRNEVWVVLDNFGIYALKGDSEIYNIGNLDDYEDFKNRSITSIQIDKNNNIYAGTVYEGVLIAVNSPFKEVIKESYTNKFNPLVLSLYKDRNNVLWCGSDNYGLFSVDSLGKVNSYFKDDYRVITHIAEYTKNELFVSVYQKGIYIFNKNTGKYKPVSSLKKFSRIRMLTDSRIYSDNSDNVFIFSDSLYCYNRGKDSVKKISSFSGKGKITPVILSNDENGNIWFVSGNFLFCYDVNKGEYLNHIKIPDVHYSAMCSSKPGEVILVFQNYIYKYLYRTGELQKLFFPVYDRKVVSILYSSYNDTYIFMTTKDILTAKLKESNVNITISTTNTKNSRMYFDNSTIIYNNNIYAGYDGGISSFNVSDLFRETKNNEVLLISLKGTNGSYNVSDTSFVLYDKVKKLTFRRPKSDYTFYFQSSMIANQNHVKYQYILEGVDSNWKIVDKSHVSYNKIHSGNYTFRVKSIDNRGVQSPESVIKINILQPLFISSFFVGIYVSLIIVVLVLLLLHYRKRLKSKIVVDWNLGGKSKSFSGNVDKSEELFINEFKSVIEKNISNCDIHVDEIASKLNVSRTVLYEKVKKISGYSVKAFINKVRLEKAKSLLQDSNNNINDISYDLGFNNPSYFSTAFKRAFDVSPSKYRSDFLKHKKSGIYPPK